MATNILAAQSLAAEVTVYSSELTNVYSIDIQAVLTAASGQQIYTIERKTENGAWRTAVDENNAPLQFRTNGADNGINIIGLNAAYARVRVDILAGGAGTLNIEYESV